MNKVGAIQGVRRGLVTLTLLLAASAGSLGAQAVKIVNIIPLKLSSEEMDNSEPTVAVRPGKATDVAVSAHIFDLRWCNGADPMSGFFASSDGGDNWTFLCTLTRQFIPRDLTLRFSGDGQTLYIGYLLTHKLFLYANDDFPYPEAMRSILSPVPSSAENVHEPKVMTFPGASSNVVIAMYGQSGNSTPGSPPCVVQIYATVSAPQNDASFKKNCVADRPFADNPYAIRIATHQSGRVYLAYLHTREDLKGWDVVVQRGTLGTVSPRLDDLREPNDGGDPCMHGDKLLGVRVGKCVNISHDVYEPAENFGWETPAGSELSVAVHPFDDKIVYLAWGDAVTLGGPIVTLHVRGSTDGGVTWGPEIFTVPNATNPGLAVDSMGRLGFLYQQLIGTTPPYRWQTRLCITTFCTYPSTNSLLLADTPTRESSPPNLHWPLLGDYLGLVAEGTTFYGVFSARNDPKHVNFPYGVRYQRACVGGHLRNLTNPATIVNPSVDPFFFRVQPDSPFTAPADTQPAC